MSEMRPRGPVAAPLPPAGWPPDDTEESVMGTNLHQATITNLRLGLNEAASTLVEPAQAPPWQALSQTGLAGLRRWDDTPYTVLPDVFVYRRPIDDRLARLPLAVFGLPALIAEVLSPDTERWDRDLEHGKGRTYAAAGIPEYLCLDLAGAFLPEQVRAWRFRDGAYVPWLSEPNGRWRSPGLGIAVGFAGVQVVVYAPDGRRMPREGEAIRELARRDAEISALRRLLEERGPA